MEMLARGLGQEVWVKREKGRERKRKGKEKEGKEKGRERKRKGKKKEGKEKGRERKGWLTSSTSGVKRLPSWPSAVPPHT
jgi:hypothetical protein